MSEASLHRIGGRALEILLVVLCVCVVGLLVFSSWCAFISCFPYEDYCRYYNMLWNTGHGRMFHYMVDDNYLLTHLSFTLILLSPFVVLIDHPFVLSMLQLLCISGGAAFVGVTARRHGLSMCYTLVFILFYLGYHLTQYVQLDEFHGVALYMLLVPWLYHSLSFSRRFLWIPFMLTLFLREEAGFMIVPLFAYIAARDKWRSGWWYAAIAFVYASAATVVLYKFLHHYSPEAYNLDSIAPRSILDGFSREFLLYRLETWVWVLLPVLPFLARGALPLAAIPAVAVIVTILSGSWRQFSLLYHYPAIIMATVTVAMMEAARLQGTMTGRWKRMTEAGVPIYLFVLTLASYFLVGVLPGALAKRDEYNYIDKSGLQALWVAQHRIPKDGVLFSQHEWCSFVGGRRNVLTFETYDKSRHRFDVIFCKFSELQKSGFLPLLQNNEFGVSYFDRQEVVVLQRGYDASANAEVLNALKTPFILFAWTRAADGERAEKKGLRRNEYLQDMGVMRYWSGDGRRAFINLSSGSSVKLEPGRYKAVFLFKASAPKRVVRGTWGLFSIYDPEEDRNIVEKHIEPGPAVFRTQEVTFELEKASTVEPRVAGADAELWLDRVSFEKVNPGGVDHGEQPP
ncbi:MAG: hypothetical protein C0404_00205 [Verrucomicrobia bacterium]|nr:hypothetical protein [Verrucomicrobiota bacterium]